jgi:hypothetical protein
MAEYFVQTATGFVCPLECLPSLLFEKVLLKSCINQAVYVRFCEELGLKIPLLTRRVCIFFNQINVRIALANSIGAS